MPGVKIPQDGFRLQGLGILMMVMMMMMVMTICTYIYIYNDITYTSVPEQEPRRLVQTLENFPVCEPGLAPGSL